MRAIRLSRTPRQYRAYGDSRLDLVNKLIPAGFLNYGYYADPSPDPETLSLQDIQRAQKAYGELIAEQIAGIEGPVLDVGAGMGGLLRMLTDRGHDATGLTPDAGQVAYLRKHLPDVPIIESKFEFLEVEPHRGRFAAVVTSESLQYLKIELALPVMKQILAPGGVWVAFDYFRVSPDLPGSGHPWPGFPRTLEEGGFRIEMQRDLTEHVLPTLSFLHMWADRLGLSLVDLFASDFKRKRPGTHHVFEESVERLREYAASVVSRTDPEEFKRCRRYRFLVIGTRAEAAATV